MSITARGTSERGGDWEIAWELSAGSFWSFLSFLCTLLQVATRSRASGGQPLDHLRHCLHFVPSLSLLAAHCFLATSASRESIDTELGHLQLEQASAVTLGQAHQSNSNPPTVAFDSRTQRGVGAGGPLARVAAGCALQSVLLSLWFGYSYYWTSFSSGA